MKNDFVNTKAWRGLPNPSACMKQNLVQLNPTTIFIFKDPLYKLPKDSGLVLSCPFNLNNYYFMSNQQKYSVRNTALWSLEELYSVVKDGASPQKSKWMLYKLEQISNNY